MLALLDGQPAAALAAARDNFRLQRELPDVRVLARAALAAHDDDARARLAEWLRQMVRLGVESIPVVFLTAMFTGMVLALQTYNGFQRVHAENFVGSVVALAMLRELSPVLVGLMVTGRVGSSMAAMKRSFW